MTQLSISHRQSESNLNENENLAILFRISAADDPHSNLDVNAEKVGAHESDSVSSKTDEEARAKTSKEINERFAKAKKTKKKRQNLL